MVDAKGPSRQQHRAPASKVRDGRHVGSTDGFGQGLRRQDGSEAVVSGFTSN
jgi:hypothetical protein